MLKIPQRWVRTILNGLNVNYNLILCPSLRRLAAPTVGKKNPGQIHAYSLKIWSQNDINVNFCFDTAT
jgi:hypothetical protein